jgi:hypothetical protein|tara:strand:- start:39 stop:167 length:129 start_codon:yes stop_codon:yes gene_type:complete
MMSDYILYFFAASGVIAWLVAGAMYWYYRACMPVDSLLKSKR